MAGSVCVCAHAVCVCEVLRVSLRVSLGGSPPSVLFTCYFMCGGVLAACMCMHHMCACACGDEKMAEIPGPRVTDGCEPLCGCLNPGPLMSSELLSGPSSLPPYFLRQGAL